MNGNGIHSKQGLPKLANPLTVTCGSLGSRRDLERDWRALEQTGASSFFQTWDWVGSLYAGVEAERAPRLLQVHSGATLVALGLFGSASHRRRGFVRSRTLHLNETGDPGIDQVTIEHNGLLAAAGFEQSATDAVARHLATLRGWDELYLSGMGSADQAAWQAAAAGNGLHHRLRWEKPYYYIDLDRIRQAGGSYLDHLSSNTRYQVRRAMRLYAARGPLRHEQASTVEQALAWLREMAVLHQCQWTAKGHAGAFGSEFKQRFHERLVASGWPRRRAQISRVSAGDFVLGYLYNFQLDGVVYNYQSGHVAEQDSKLKPGLVSHCLVVEQALQDGHKVYDLLMGGDHFKSSLTNATGSLYWATVQQPRISLQVEDLLRRGHDLLRSAQKRWAAPGGSTPPAGEQHLPQLAGKVD